MLTIVTGNEKKFEEYIDKIGSHFRRESLDLIEIQGTPEEIIRHKARTAFENVGKCIVEDVSFEIECWEGLPGPYIKTFNEKMGAEKISKFCLGSKAVARCLIGIAFSRDEIRVVEGRTYGKIVFPRKGRDFGFDPIFVPDGEDKTYSEMSIEEKNKISHRAKAIDKLKELLFDYPKL